MQTLISFLRSFQRDDHGGVALTFAVALVPLVGAFGAAIDYSRASAARTALQSSLDAAALNSIKQASTVSEADLYDAVKKSFQSTFFRPEALNVILTPTYDPVSRTLTVHASANVKVQMMGLLGLSNIQISSLTKATSAGLPPACVIVLDPTANKAMDVSGNGSINVPNCGIHVNSKATVALEQKGSSVIKAKSVKVVGGALGTSITPTPKENQEVLKDPLSTIVEPAVPGACTYMNKDFSLTQTLAGNSVYCGSIAFTGNITFGSGIHYFKNANVSVGSTTNIVGDEVMFFFDGSSSFSSTSSGTFKLTAMSTGPYAGVAVFGARTGSGVQEFRFRGSKEYFVNGTIYLPNAALDLKGTSDLAVSSKSGFVVARRFSYSGDSSFTFDAHGGVVPSAFGANNPILTQ